MKPEGKATKIASRHLHLFPKTPPHYSDRPAAVALLASPPLPLPSLLRPFRSPASLPCYPRTMAWYIWANQVTRDHCSRSVVETCWDSDALDCVLAILGQDQLPSPQWGEAQMLLDHGLLTTIHVPGYGNCLVSDVCGV